MRDESRKQYAVNHGCILSDDYFNTHISGLKNLAFPTNRAQHYCSLLMVHRHPWLFKYSHDAERKMVATLQSFDDQFVINQGELLYQKRCQLMEANK